jgi:hypothetical protein
VIDASKFDPAGVRACGTIERSIKAQQKLEAAA